MKCCAAVIVACLIALSNATDAQGMVGSPALRVETASSTAQHDARILLAALTPAMLNCQVDFVIMYNDVLVLVRTSGAGNPNAGPLYGDAMQVFGDCRAIEHRFRQTALPHSLRSDRVMRTFLTDGVAAFAAVVSAAKDCRTLATDLAAGHAKAFRNDTTTVPAALKHAADLFRRAAYDLSRLNHQYHLSVS